MLVFERIRMENIMKRLDPRSVLIGLLLAIIGFLSLGLTERIREYDIVIANQLHLRKGGSLTFAGNNGLSFIINQDGLMMKDQGDKHIGIGIISEKPLTYGISFQDRKESTYITSNYIGLTGDNNCNLSDDMIAFENNNKKQVATLAVGPEKNGMIFLTDRRGNLRWSR